MNKRKIMVASGMILILLMSAIAVWVIEDRKDDFKSVEAYVGSDKSSYSEGEEVSITFHMNNTMNYAFKISGSIGIFRIPDEVNPAHLINDSRLNSEVMNYDKRRIGLHGIVTFEDYTHDSDEYSITWNGTILAGKAMLFNLTSNGNIYVKAPSGYYFIHPMDVDYYDHSERHFVRFFPSERSIFYYDGLDFKVSYYMDESASADVECKIFVDNKRSANETLECHIEGRLYGDGDGDKISEDFVLLPGANATYRMSCSLPLSNQETVWITILVKTTSGNYYFSHHVSKGMICNLYYTETSWGTNL